MDSYSFYNPQAFSGVGFPPTPQGDFDPDSPPVSTIGRDIPVNTQLPDPDSFRVP